MPMDSNLSETMRILILEDDRIIARDISEIVEGMDGTYQVRSAHSYHEAMELLQNFSPDVIISDIHLASDKTGIDFVKKVKSLLLNMELIYLTAHSDVNTLTEASATDPIHYLVKPYNSKQVRASVQMAISAIQQKRILQPDLSLLSEREQVILRGIAQSLSSKQIAEQLSIAEKTVRNHRYNIAKKLNLSKDKNSLLIWAMEHINK